MDSLGGQKDSTEKEKDSFSKAVREENERDNVGKLKQKNKRHPESRKEEGRRKVAAWGS